MNKLSEVRPYLLTFWSSKLNKWRPMPQFTWDLRSCPEFCLKLAYNSPLVACCCVLLSWLPKVWNRSNFWASDSQHFFLFRDRRNVAQQLLHPCATPFQHCWGHTSALHMAYIVLLVVSFPRCTAGPTLLGVVASVRTPLPTQMQQLPTLLALHVALWTPA